ncbi:MAG TPA: glycosyltransferase family 87 protein [Rhizomicrobium sp.]|nr:glycosyltransferase family 87 protein [Rhizomicrobium sp.]
MDFGIDSEDARANRAALRTCATMGLVFFAAILAVYVFLLQGGVPIPRDGSGLVVGRDFLNFWMYGHAAFSAEPGRWYDLAAYHKALASLLGPGYPGQNWSYPPSIMLLAAPFGLMGYLPALLSWTLAGLALFVFVLRGRASSRLALAALVSPASAFCLISGQSSLITAALLITVFTCLDRRPLLAGLLIGLLSLKPQLALLLPVALAASGRWRAFVAAAAMVLAIAALSLVLFGPESWIRFVTLGLPAQNLVLHDAQGIAVPFYPTIFMNLHGAGLGYKAAMTMQVLFALAAAIAVAWAFRRRRDADPGLLFALFTACTVMALPYLLIYDTLPLTVAALLLLEKGLLDSRGRLLARLIYWLPLLQIGFGRWHVPGPAMIAVLFTLHIFLRSMPRAMPASGGSGLAVAE